MTNTQESLPVLALVGATATGKSAVSLAIAKIKQDKGEAVEIINADSMQFYKGMDIGTAKLLPHEREGVAHHQFDTLDVNQDASVARFQADARADIKRIVQMGKLPMVVGGSGLYLRAVLDHFEFPGTDPEVRERLERRAEAEGPGILYGELMAQDPAAAAKIHPRNAKRIVRALEIIELNGSYTSSLPEHEYEIPAVQVALHLPFEFLDERIESRVADMWDKGLVSEVEALVELGIRDGVTAQRAVGYAETLAYLDGHISEVEARELIARNTRRLARRQERWFRPDSRVVWVDAPRDLTDVDRAAHDVIQAWYAAAPSLKP